MADDGDVEKKTNSTNTSSPQPQPQLVVQHHARNIHDQYFMGPLLGEGGFGSVCQCRRKEGNGSILACKTVRKHNTFADDLIRRECEVMRHLSSHPHPSVVSLHAVYEDSGHFHLVMEWCKWGDLMTHIEQKPPCSERYAAFLLLQLMLALKHIHRIGVVHRDIKPENLLITASGFIKLCDFGLAARISKGETLSGVVGTPSYVAPEVVGNFTYTEKADIWSVGVLLHALLFRFLPYSVRSTSDVTTAINTANLDFDGERWDSRSALARDLMRRLLTTDVSLRITLDQVLKHPWILHHTERPKARSCAPSTTTPQDPSSILEPNNLCRAF